MRRFANFCNRFLYRGAVFALAVWMTEAAHADDGILPSLGHMTDVRYQPRVWETDEGLPYNRVDAIAQTPDGYLMVGTYYGLARFDGLQFTLINFTSTAGVTNGSITALCTTADGTLWIGTERGAVVRWRNGRGFLFRPQNGKSVSEIYQGPSGAIWIPSSRGLEQIYGSSRQSYTSGQGLLSDTVTAIYEDDETNVWIGTTKGLNCLCAGQMKSFPGIAGISNNPVRALCGGRGSRVWIGTDHGLIHYQSGQFHVYTTRNGLSDNLVSAVFEDGQSNLWVGTYSGLNRFIDGHFRPELSASGMPYDKITTIMEDRWGNIWAGSREGLIRLTVKPFSVYTTRQGLSHNYTKSVLEDQLGRLWVGTWGGGLNEFAGDKVRVHARTNQFPTDFILALCADRNGGIWVGSDDRGGLSYVNDQMVTHYTTKNGLPNAAISALYQDRTGELWLGTTAGLWRRHDELFVRERGCGAGQTRALCEDSEGDLWIGDGDRLIRHHGGTFSNLTAAGHLPFSPITALAAGADGKTIWVGTSFKGLFRWRDNRFDRFTMQQGLPTDEILGILEDHGWLWMTSTRGIFRVRKVDLETPGIVMPCVTYGKADGLESIVCSGPTMPSICKMADGRLCFATTKGLAVVDGRNIRLDLSPPPVRIEAFAIDRKEMALPVTGELIVPPNHGELEFRYTALDLRAPERCRFKYKLDDVDRDWVDAGTRRVAHYNNVNPGRHSFHVIACNKDGVWNQDGAAVGLLLQPHVWQMMWFQLLCGTVVLGSAVGVARTATRRRMQRRIELMEQQHAVERERARIAKDIHDELGSSLTRIMLLGRATRQDLEEHKEIEPLLQKIEASCDATIQTMDEIVWAVNPEHDTLDGLAGYLSEYAAEFFEDTPIRCQFELPATPLRFVLPAEIRHDLFLAVKEALNNVLKHSGASGVLVRVSVEGEMLQIVIRDNGCGFDTNQPASGRAGHGLGNISHRLEKHGGRFELVTESGKGTTLSFFLRVKQQKAGSVGTIYS